MNVFECNEVYGNWTHVANPDDIDVTLNLGQTTHNFYPALRELVLLYDAVVHKREAELIIGCGNFVVVSIENAPDNIIDIKLPPVHFKSEHKDLINDIELLLTNVFKQKDEISTREDREEGLGAIQYWIDTHEGTVNIHDLYVELVDDEGE